MRSKPKTRFRSGPPPNRACSAQISSSCEIWMARLSSKPTIRKSHCRADQAFRSRLGDAWHFAWRSFQRLPEADEPDRRVVNCGTVAVRASGLRIVENFLDLAHFPFVHTDILGAEPHTEVTHYNVEIRRDVDEVMGDQLLPILPAAGSPLRQRRHHDRLYLSRHDPVHDPALQDLPECGEPLGRLICLFDAAARSRPLPRPSGDVLDRRHLDNDGGFVHFQQLIFLQGPHHPGKPTPRIAADGSARRDPDPRRRHLDSLSPLAAERKVSPAALTIAGRLKKRRTHGST